MLGFDSNLDTTPILVVKNILIKLNLKLMRRFVSTVLHRLAYKTDSFTSIYSAVLKISQEFTIKGLNNFIIEGA